jgi:hypothetical protein
MRPRLARAALSQRIREREPQRVAHPAPWRKAPVRRRPAPRLQVLLRLAGEPLERHRRRPSRRSLRREISFSASATSSLISSEDEAEGRRRLAPIQGNGELLSIRFACATRKRSVPVTDWLRARRTSLRPCFLPVGWRAGRKLQHEPKSAVMGSVFPGWPRRDESGPWLPSFAVMENQTALLRYNLRLGPGQGFRSPEIPPSQTKEFFFYGDSRHTDASGHDHQTQQ